MEEILHIRQVRKIAESLGMTLEDRGNSYELKSKEVKETGAYYPKDKEGLKYLKRAIMALQKSG